MKVHITITKIFCLYFLLFFCLRSFSQFYETGQVPASVQWKEIKTEHFHIIFPDNFYDQANHYANVAEYSYPHLSEGFASTIKRIPVIFHNTSILSNGYVIWTPKRMELFNISPQNTYSQPWANQLVLHETRHVNQLYNLNTGFTKLLNIFSGQIGTAVAAAYVPLWYYEGDAVFSETYFSSSGRGRQPSFAMELKAIQLEKGKKYSYDKASLGSYKHHIPNHYQLGYQLISYLKSNEKSNIPEKLPTFTGNFSFLPFSFSLGLKHYSGMTKTQLYDKTFDTLTTLWNKNLNNIILTDHLRISGNHKYYTSYNTPQHFSDDSYIVKKSGIDRITGFVQIDKNGNENTIYTPGFINTDILSVKNGLMAWTEIVPDIRWSNRDYSVICLYDLKSKKKKTLTKCSRYFSPALSDDAEKLVCVETDPQNMNSLVILDTKNGEILKKIRPPGNFQIIMPSWYDNSVIVAILLDKSGKSFWSYHIQNKEWKKISEPVYHDISHPAIWKNYIIFHSSFSGIDNIHALNIHTKEEYRITSVKFGAFEPCVSGNTLAYSCYSSEGHYICETPIDSSKWIPVKESEPLEIPWMKTISAPSEKNIQQSEIEIKKYDSKPYHEILHLFRFHSWAPFYIDYKSLNSDLNTIKPGIILFSQNNLNTFTSSFSYRYENGNHIFSPSFIFKGWYPVLELNHEWGGSPLVIRDGSEPPPNNLLNHNKLIIRSYIPFNLTRNKYYRIIYPIAEYEYQNIYYYDNGYKLGLFFLTYRLQIRNYLKTSHRDIYPKWGQSAELNYSHSLNDSHFGSLYAGNFRIYFPGLFNHHSLRLHFGYQHQLSDRYNYVKTYMLLPRGLEYRKVYDLRDAYKISADYTLPLLYPDLSFGPLAYIKRLRANVFYDYCNFKYPDPVTYLNKRAYIYSTGIEFTSDIHFLRFFPLFSPGIRFSYLPEAVKNYRFEFLLSIDPYLF